VPRFKKGDTVRITLAGTVDSPRFSGGVYDVKFRVPSTWDKEQSLAVYEGNLVRAKASQTLQGCQDCIRSDLLRLAQQEGPLHGMTLYINVQSHSDCISGHGGVYTDEERPSKADPDDIVEDENETG
jgi:hypothetical protein